MAHKKMDLLSRCSEIDFGRVPVSGEEKDFCAELNREIIKLLDTLPESAQTDAFLFFMNYFNLLSDSNLNFMAYYYVPTWSILYWLQQRNFRKGTLGSPDIQNARTGHAMAMIVHALDDHLHDDELPATPLALLIRSQAWMLMNHAFVALAHAVTGGQAIVRSFIDDYYTGMTCAESVQSFDAYCDLFRKQMAIGFAAPVLLSKQLTSDPGFAADIQEAYGSFGISWRLLDDLRDITSDITRGEHTSIYFLLPEEIRTHWISETDNDPKTSRNIVLSYISEHTILEKVCSMICGELASAASLFEKHGMNGLADELRCLSRPLLNRRAPDDPRY